MDFSFSHLEVSSWCQGISGLPYDGPAWRGSRHTASGMACASNPSSPVNVKYDHCIYIYASATCPTGTGFTTYTGASVHTQACAPEIVGHNMGLSYFIVSSHLSFLPIC